MNNVDTNLRYIRFSEALALVLAECSTLPAAVGIRLSPITEPILDVANVALQMNNLGDIALWAEAMNVPVRVIESDSCVHIVARQTVNDDVRFEVWGHMPHGDAWRLMVKHDKTLSRDGVDLSPDAILADLARERAS